MKGTRWIITVCLGIAGAYLPGHGQIEPAWLGPVFSGDITALTEGHSAVRLLAAGEVRYMSNTRARSVLRGAVRVLKEGGRGYAECRFPYNADLVKIVKARAWLVSPDGQTSRTFGTNEFVDAAEGRADVYWNRERVLAFDATARIAIGGVLAWELDFESQADIFDSNWGLPEQLPTRLCTFEVYPSSGGHLKWHANAPFGPPLQGNGTGALRWEIRDHKVPAPGKTPDNLLFLPVPLSVRQEDSAVGTPVQSWLQFAQLAVQVVEPRLVISPEVRAQAQILTTGKTARWDIVQALAAFVQTQVTYLSLQLDNDYLAGYRPNTPTDVLHNRFGDCKDKAGLLVALLRSEGIDSHAVLLYAENPLVVEQDWPSARFNHAIVAIPADQEARPNWPRLRDKTMGDLILFDPTDYYIPFGLLPAADQGGNALIVSPATEDVARIPYAGPEANRHELQLDGRMDTNGDLSVSAIERFGGGMGDWLRGRRQSVTQNDFSSTLESRLHANTQFVDGLVWKDNGPRSEQWEIGYTYKALSFLHPTSTDLVMVPLPKLWAEQSIRPWPVNLEGKSYVESESLVKHLRLVLPQGFTIEELPDPLDKRIGTASCRLSYQTDGNAVVYQCSYQREGGILSRAAYEALRLFDQEILDAENRPLLVRGQLTTR